MNQQEYQVAKGVATKCLGFDIHFNGDGRVQMEMGGSKWEFSDKTDAEAIEEIEIIFNQVLGCMWLVVNEKVAAWVAQNKTNFN